MAKVTAIIFLLLISLQSSADPFQFRFHDLGSGVWAGERVSNTRFPVMGSVTFVITDEGVIVYDGGGTALMADRAIAKITSLTDKPVTHVVISHWHGDHHFGIYRYLEAYKNVQVIAHTFTDRMLNSERIRYIDRQPTLMSRLIPKIQATLVAGVDDDTGEPLTTKQRAELSQTIADEEIVQQEMERLKITQPTLVIDDKLVIKSGGKTIHIKYLGDGNTAGDLVMWIPHRRVVAVGDLVVYPIPYGFNVPPRRWANTLQALNQLEYEVLVPGHGTVQRDQNYVNLLIRESTNIADQRDAMLAKGVEEQDVAERLDFSEFEHLHTKGDASLSYYYNRYFKRPFAQAAMKALKDEPMVPIPAKNPD